MATENRTGHLFCFFPGVQLFEILQDGFHTPLTEAQISQLFQAGRLNRHTPCKPVKQAAWRTIDELFPLLKYHTPWRFAYQSAPPSSEFRFRQAIVVGVGFVAAAAAALIVYLYVRGQNSLDRPITAIDRIPSSSLPSVVPAAPVFSTQPIQNPVSGPVAQPQTQDTIRLAEAQRINEQARRDQALAEQQRTLHERMLLEQQQAAGRDEHVPFDQWQVINVGGESVRVKIHDNDVTSFDVWINYGPRHELKKEKGITHSRTDEILLYNNGRAALYYVWEISGRINHCLLRVRDA